MPLVVFQHVDFLGKFAVAFFTLVLFDAFVKLHVVPQSMLGFHACRGTHLHHIRIIQTPTTPCVLCSFRQKEKRNEANLSHILHTGSPGCRREP